MQNSSDAGGRRPVILYIIVAVVLFAALIVGVRFAKDRANYYAQQPTEQPKTASNQGDQSSGKDTTPATNPTPTETTPSTPSTASTPPAPTSQPVNSGSETQNTPAPTPVVASKPAEATPARVPSTGPEQVYLTLFALSALAFTSMSYMRARRRLARLGRS